ncbi:MULTISPECIES: sigma 54-interacting transcriptional regulator [unclassified Sporosarcina]|uniref:sigma 54-interacting transcriptional regulator n=1 Tax=unclassified Sporosarcina TaxID=2647733 RepID=UPI00203F3B45|nr:MULTISPECIES: sigma 54-interacting transcriptional regulator [unclassified Sporosarcina]GKV65910.1 sigma-54-dependent Fis family transcriptional regulator [Sporosarcina sp. NCCP-2331]GLB56090.1 sigma-54-dependent Fis family transcriptional regulator [Sporosarcina sp. NCCP-2378]
MVDIKITLVVPSRNFINHAFNIFREHNLVEHEEINGRKVNFEMEEVVWNGDEVLNQKFTADVIMARGITCQTLKRSNPELPVVDIPVQGLDLIRSLDDCKKLYGTKKVGVIGSNNMIYGVEKLTNIVGMPINSYIMNKISEGPRLVELAKQEGCQVILAGVKTCEYANSIGLYTSLIKTGRETFHHSLKEAKRLALVSRREQEKTELHKTILNHAYEGVIAINNKNQVLVFNSIAHSLLSITSQDFLGKSVYEIMPQGKLRAMLLSEMDSHESSIITYRSIQLAVKKIGFFLKGQRVGNMVAFQAVSGIQDIEIKVRKEMHLRGHVAKHTFIHILHESRIMNRTIEMAKRFSKADSSVLIIGETGTGKEIFAQSIHNFSNRKKGPFVAMNCAALPENLLESELFGYAEGAFTGAMKGGKKGFFELAHGGTIFLDEVGEISPGLQSRLLRVLQEKEINRIGDDKVIPTNVRIISATNKNLFDMVKQGEFREDLYYRLDVLRLSLPPLRERVEDIPLLVKSFVLELSNLDEQVEIKNAAMQRLVKYRWQGNIRQLKNFCERLMIMRNNNLIDVGDVDNWLGIEEVFDENKMIETEEQLPSEVMSEREEILITLKRVHFHRGKAAEWLGISRSTLWRKMKQLGIETK